MPNETAIKFLSELNEDACVVIFTRDDAATQTPDERTVTDDEWRAIVRDFDKNFLFDDHWTLFGEIVNRNLDSNPESE